LSRILFAWELGANLGHVGPIAPIAARLEEEGHDLLFAVRDIAPAHKVLRGKRTRIVQAPVGRAAPRREPAVSYADMLGTVGYADSASIAALLRGWLDLFSLFDPQAVVVDHAPGALLAARIAGLPTADVGNGFAQPPRTHPLPSMQPWREFPAGHLAGIEADLLERINAALRSHRAAPLARLADLFAVDASFLTTFEELDPYEGRTGEAYHGALIPQGIGAVRDWPDGDRPYVLAYLRSSPILETALDAITTNGAAAICVVPDAEPALVERYAASGIDIVRESLNLEAVLQGAHATLGYGGQGFVSASLLAGVPCVIIPDNMEQVLTARRVTQMGAGLAITRTRVAADLSGQLKRVLLDLHYRSCASTFKQRYADFQPAGVVARIGRAVSRFARPAGKLTTCL
jgi:UDP:flavonoid glycosyltransferase YjiC (YdhE family)